MKRFLPLFSCATVLLSSLVAVLVSTPAHAADCTTLTAEQTVYSAPPLTGTTSAGNPDCYHLDLVAGEHLLLIVEKLAGFGSIGLSEPEGGHICDSSDTCRVPYTGTFQINVDSTVGAYQVRVARLSGGCPPMNLSTFGPADDFNQVTIPALGVNCRQLTLSAGKYFANTGGPGYSEIVAADGGPFCADNICTIPTSGTYFLVRTNPLEKSAKFRTKIIPLTDTTSCAAKLLAKSWKAPDTTFTPDRFHISCGLIEAGVDSYIIPRASFSSGGDLVIYVVDAQGNIVCMGRATCHLQGAAPFRMLLEGEPSGTSPDLRASARQVGAGADCAQLPVSAFGSLSTDPNSAIKCRIFDGSAGQQVALIGFRPKNKLPIEFSVYDSQLEPVCPNLSPGRIFCQLPSTGVYTVLTSGATALRMQNVNLSTGCTNTKLGLETRAVNLAATQVQCVELANPGKSEIAVSSDWIGRADHIDVAVFDSAGQSQCWLIGGEQFPMEACPLSGPAPYRAVIGAGKEPQKGRVGLFDPADPSCPDVTASGNDEVRVTADPVLKCVLVPSSIRANPEWMRLQRKQGTGLASMTAFVPGSAPKRMRDPSVSPTVYVERDATQPAQVFLVADGPGVFKFLNQAFDGSTPNWVKPSITGEMKPGKRVTAEPGEWYLDKTLSVRFKYRWLLDGVPIAGATSKSLVLTRAQSGKQLSVEVTGTAEGLRPGIAVSDARKVK